MDGFGGPVAEYGRAARPLLGLALAIPLVLLAGVACGQKPEPSTSPEPCDRPNVLLYVVDTLRADHIGRDAASGSETPAADRLAREGRFFANALAPSSWTRASIGSILTGLYPDVHGAQGRDSALPAHLETLAELLRQHRYTTAAVVTNPNVGSFYGFDQGFDTYLQLFERREPGRIKSGEAIVRSDQVTEQLFSWIDDATCPFFLSVLTIDPHWPYGPPTAFDRFGAEYSGPVDTDKLAIKRDDLTPADRDRIRALYRGEVAFNDASLGMLLEKLESEGRLDDTIVILTSDHGEEFWEHGGVLHGTTLYDEVLRVPLIIRYPKAVTAERVTSQVSLVDIAPTLLELLGIDAPYPFDGVSLLQSASENRSVHAMLELDGRRSRSMSQSSWKLIENWRNGSRALFDLDRDPGETKNLISENRERVSAMSAEMLRLRRAHRQRREAMRSGAPVQTTPATDLPDDARKALEALGYLDSPN